MKRVIAICLLITGIYACNSGSTDTKTDAKVEEKAEAKEEPKEAAKVDPADTPEFQKGLELVKNSDCNTCHKVDEKVIGPSFREIANKYPNNAATLDTLAHKIINGGSGNWGSIAMAPHKDLSVEDAKAIAEYVLLLKNN
jgi:cytochrome c